VNHYYYERQIKGLLLILSQKDGDDFMTKDYFSEKLNMILNGGINFHTILDKTLDEADKIIDDRISNKSW